MNVFLIILAVLLAVLLILVMIPIRLEILCERDELENKASVRIKYAFLNLGIYPKKPSKRKKAESEEEKEEEEKEEKEPFSFEKKKADIEKYLRMFDLVKQDAARLVSYTAKHAVEFDRVEYSSDFGFEDAMHTGIFTGIYNGLVYSVMGVIHANSQLRGMDIRLQPVFGKTCFNIRFLCILRIKTVHIIVIAFRVLILMRRIKKEGRK